MATTPLATETAFVGVLARETSLEELAAVESELFTNVFLLVNSSDDIEELAGVAALSAMISAAKPALSQPCLPQMKLVRILASLGRGDKSAAEGMYEA
jgi:hypothetical protein